MKDHLSNSNLSPDYEWIQHHFFKLEEPLDSYRADFKSDNLTNSDDSASTVWLAWAKFKTNQSNSSQHKRSNHIQKQAVRHLLSELINYYRDDIHSSPHTNSVESLSLDESQYPYRLTPLGYYVSFSHSKDTVSCVISRTPIGIDIELSDVPLSVSKRFYHDDEFNWIATLEDSNQQQAINLLWMLKEATIKRYSDNHIEANLIKGLKRNLTLPAQQLLLQSKGRHDNNNGSPLNSDVPHTSFTIHPLDKTEEHQSAIQYVYIKSLNLVIGI